jgi:hypothetical protein
MAKRRTVEEKLAQIRQLRGAAPSPEVIRELGAALKDASNLVVAEAAALIGRTQAVDLRPTLVGAFERFLENPLKADKLCRAKNAIAEALNELEFSEEEFYWRGARYVQLEPVWGGSVDSAAPLRVACAFALVRLRAHGVHEYLADMLNDPEKAARVGAAQALAYSGTDAAGLLLRLKAGCGDAEPEVIAECFNGLVKLSSEGVDFVARFLDAGDLAIQEAALLALGDSRRAPAFPILQAFWEREGEGRLQETILMAISLLRQPAATDFLLSLVAKATERVARAAIIALAIHRYDGRIREHTAAAAAAHGRAGLRAFFLERFGEDRNAEGAEDAER